MIFEAASAQVLTAGQELAFDYQGDLFILRPVSMMVAASQSKSAPQGLLTDTTAITFEPAPGLYGVLQYLEGYRRDLARGQPCLSLAAQLGDVTHGYTSDSS